MTKTKQSRASADRNAESNSSHSKGVLKTKRTRKSLPRESPSQRSSVYRGVTRHRWTGRYEAHLWDKNSWNESQNKRGRQVYLGAYDDEEAAARAYDLAALKYWGQDTILNFPLSTYHEELKGMEAQSREEYIGSLRRKSSGFSRGVSKYRGVARHHHNGRWEARIGRVLGNKYLYLGTYATQEEAATAYDMAAIEYRGLNAVTNFDLSRYIKCLRPKPEGRKPSINLQPTAGSAIADAQPSPQFRQQQKLGIAATADVSVADADANKSVTTSALGIFLQSTKFKEMLGRTATSEVSSGRINQPPRCSFPEDIQTYFECHDNGGFVEGDGTLFGELNAFETPIFQYELDV